MLSALIIIPMGGTYRKHLDSEELAFFSEIMIPVKELSLDSEIKPGLKHRIQFENYHNQPIKEYITLLSSDKLPSDRFWEFEKRIREDKRATGVVVTNSRSKMIDNILDLLHEGAITLDDLSDFSEELQEKIRFIYSGGYNNPDNCNRL